MKRLFYFDYFNDLRKDKISLNAFELKLKNAKD